MERQPRRVRLTDQALVAVTVARRLAGNGRTTSRANGRANGGASVAHLVAGLEVEPDGVAGGLLAVRQSAAAGLVERAGSASARLPSLEAAVAWAQPTGEGVPLWTLELLRAALEVGAGDLDDHLEAAGHDPDALRSRLGRAPWDVDGRWTIRSDADEIAAGSRCDPETVRLEPDGRLDGPAALAVGRARAQGGRLRHLVSALLVAREDGWPPPFVPEALQAAVAGSAGAAALDDVVAGAPHGATCRGLAEAVLTGGHPDPDADRLSPP